MRQELDHLNPSIIRVVLNKFDQESINRAVADYTTFPVKVFVNCKSSKRSTKSQEIDQKEREQRQQAMLKETIITMDTQVNNIINDDIDVQNFEVSTKAEVHYNGKENIEGYAALVNMFLRTMLMTSSNPCLINVNNVDKKMRKHQKCEDGQVFYNATLAFKN